MKLISIIGTGNYQPTRYTFNGKCASASIYVQAALKELFEPDSIVVLMTAEAKEKHGYGLAKHITYTELPIPTGKTEDELWQLFQLVIDAVDENEELILDVTHGFRSQPMLLLAISVFLRTVKNVSIKHIVYGAFESKDECNQAPLFDLKPFMDIIDWSYATNDFLRRGNSAPLAELINQTHSDARKNPSSYLPQNLQNVGRELNLFQEAFGLTRITELPKLTSTVRKKIAMSAEDVSQLIQAAPFKAFIRQIEDKIAFLDVEEAQLFTPKGLLMQSELLNYYVKTQHYQQAVTLGRELMVTYVAHLLHISDFTEKDERLKAESFLNQLVEMNKTNPASISDNERKMAICWATTSQIRNDINHAGMNKNPKPAKKLVNQIVEVSKQISQFIAEFSNA